MTQRIRKREPKHGHFYRLRKYCVISWGVSPEEVEGADDFQQLEKTKGFHGTEHLGIVVHLGHSIVLAYLHTSAGNGQLLDQNCRIITGSLAYF